MPALLCLVVQMPRQKSIRNCTESSTSLPGLDKVPTSSIMLFYKPERDENVAVSVVTCWE